MKTVVLLIFAILGVFFIVVCLLAPRMKEENKKYITGENEDENLEPISASFLCHYGKGNIIILKDGSLAFLLGKVPSIGVFDVYIPKIIGNPLSYKVFVTDIDIYVPKKTGLEIDANNDRVVEPLSWFSDDVAVAKLLGEDQQCVIRCSEKDFELMAVDSSTLKEFEEGIDRYQAVHYKTKVLIVRKTRIRVPECYLKK